MVVRSSKACLIAACVAISAACGPTTAISFQEADKWFRDGNWQEAVVVYDEIAMSRGATPAEKVQALTRAALIMDRIGDRMGARRRLERATEQDQMPGVEVPLFYLAEQLREEDHAQAMSLYYRAAAAAEKKGRTFPYAQCMRRIMEMARR